MPSQCHYKNVSQFLLPDSNFSLPHKYSIQNAKRPQFGRKKGSTRKTYHKSKVMTASEKPQESFICDGKTTLLERWRTPVGQLVAQLRPLCLREVCLVVSWPLVIIFIIPSEQCEQEERLWNRSCLGARGKCILLIKTPSLVKNTEVETSSGESQEKVITSRGRIINAMHKLATLLHDIGYNSCAHFSSQLLRLGQGCGYGGCPLHP